MTKKLFVFLLTMVLYGSIQAQQNFAEVLTKARDSGRNVLIVFSGSD